MVMTTNLSLEASNNVIRLPTAAPRKVKQPTRAARQFRAESDSPVRFKMVPICEISSPSFSRSPELLLAMCIIKVLSPEQRAEVQRQVAMTAKHFRDESSQVANWLVLQLGPSDLKESAVE
jgi:hypothetical protein